MDPVIRMATRLKARLSALDQRLQGGEAVAESLVWIAAWLLIPVHLGRSGVGAGTFAIYAAGAGLLVSLGALATANESFGGWGQFAGHLIRSSLALLIAGGTVFLLVSGWTSPPRM